MLHLLGLRNRRNRHDLSKPVSYNKTDVVIWAVIRFPTDGPRDKIEDVQFVPPLTYADVLCWKNNGSAQLSSREPLPNLVPLWEDVCSFTMQRPNATTYRISRDWLETFLDTEVLV